LPIVAPILRLEWRELEASILRRANDRPFALQMFANRHPARFVLVADISALASDGLPERTRRSYLEMLRMLEASGIPLVAVQYPVRSIEPLRRLLGARKDVWIVDNEAVFKEALRQAPYAEYFVDTFGGDFGHTTPQGAHLLAENVAQSILAGLFRQ